MHGGRILKTAQGVRHMVQAVKILPATDEIWTNQLRSSFASSTPATNPADPLLFHGQEHARAEGLHHGDSGGDGGEGVAGGGARLRRAVTVGEAGASTASIFVKRKAAEDTHCVRLAALEMGFDRVSPHRPSGIRAQGGQPADSLLQRGQGPPERKNYTIMENLVVTVEE